MLPPLPSLDAYDISPHNGFLPEEPPLEVLPDPYYTKWEAVVKHLQALVLSKRLREVVQDLPVITTSRLRRPAEWRRAYSLLSLMTHAYIWGGDRPEEVLIHSLAHDEKEADILQIVPPSISIPFTQVCAYLELPTVATYSGLCLWNWKTIFDDEPIDSLDNLSTLSTITGSLDESWFYLISVAIEARGGPTIPLMLRAIAAAEDDDIQIVTECLHVFAERLDELGSLLIRMYENCDPHVFYHRIRPFLAGSKNMADAGLPRGVLFDTDTGRDKYVQYGGGSNAQSSLFQFFDIVLGIEHAPTGSSLKPNDPNDPSQAPPPRHNFIHEMRSYMPGPHRRFLSHISSVANIRPFIATHKSNKPLTIAYDACLAMLRSLRDKHMQMVSRYIIVKSHESRNQNQRSLSPRAAPSTQPAPMNLASANVKQIDGKEGPDAARKKLRGTGGTALIPFLKQARDETGEPAVDDWFRRTMTSRQDKGRGRENEGIAKGSGKEKGKGFANLGSAHERADGEVEIVGLSAVWRVDDEGGGGICHW
ncbi:uncharacterized protein KY384_008088 [Bacidia gigantensis]|uniref:uncharacterized protein n=1 Tax=Bacidia gigantensis TaxID=2732470 RepID=UPI001D0451A1|nr:uncharacterized protein KY384_008088 [Bacidia gigantensis]KAG8526659.1 hypothetical protein KY384_008088 [Bacidia gigantensis]